MKKIIKLSILLILAIALSVLVFLAFRSRNTLRKTVTQGFSNLSPKQEAFTELYFENNEHLPAKQAPITNFQHVAYTFSFTIHNQEGKDTSYPYQVRITGADNQILDAKTILVKNNGTKTISEVFYLPNLVLTKTEIIVTLTQKNQEIHFWMGGNQ